jgi:hypothetical protein
MHPSCHPHPPLCPHKPPQTVQDQIRLWERETQRVDMSPAFWYSNFEDVTLYERSRAFAQQRGVLLWDSAERQQMVVTQQGGSGIVCKGGACRITQVSEMPLCSWALAAFALAVTHV